MKQKLALLLAFLMLLGLMACAAEPAVPAEPDAPADTTTTTPAEPADEPGEAPADVSTDEPAEEPTEEPADMPPPETSTQRVDPNLPPDMPKGFAKGTLPYPICDPGEITMEYWLAVSDFVIQDSEIPYENNVAWAEIERITGVTIDWSLFSFGNYSTQISLMFASEVYPDMANVIGINYNGGWQQAIEDGVIVDLAEYEDLMPNHMRWVNYNEANRKNAYTDQGSMPGFAMVYNRTQAAWLGYMVRQNWLDDLGLAMPETIDEWDTVLRAFKEEKTNGAGPLDLGSGGTGPMNFIEGAFNFTAEGTVGIIAVDDVLHSAYRDQGLYDYLDLMHGWYVDGLINSDFVSSQGTDNDRLANDECGIIAGVYTQAGDFFAQAGIASEDTYFSVMPMPTAEGYERNIYHLGKYSSALLGPTQIVFADSEYVEEAIRWTDYRYSEDGYLLSNYGLEGETYNFNENGERRLVELIADNPNGLSIDGAMQVYLIHNGAVVFLLEREESQVNDEGLKYNDLWSKRGDWNMSGALTMTVDESEECGMLITDINTYVSEFMVKTIIGQIELNEDSWNEFQDTLTAMKLDRVVEIQQQAYDRYLQR